MIVYLCYTCAQAYAIVLLRIPELGYKIERVNEMTNEIEVWQWVFPFSKRRFTIKVMKENEATCYLTVQELGLDRDRDEHERDLKSLVYKFF